jgi:VCBS repeat-containing protein
MVLLRLDETSGSTFADFYGAHNATASVAPTAVTGKIKGAQLFDANTEVNIPDMGDEWDFAARASFSMECWMKTSETKAQVAISRYRINAGDSLTSWWMGINPDGYASVEIRDNWSHNSVLIGSTNLADGQWHYLVATRNGTTDEDILYVDGVEVVSHSVGLTADFDCPLITDVTVGYMLRESGEEPYHFIGALDEIAIYTRALTTAEVVSFYNSGTPKRHCNYPPAATSTAITSATEDVAYSYTYTVNDQDAGDVLTLSAVTKPSWLNFTWTSGTKTATLSGTPTNDNVGTSNVTLRVSDGYAYSDQTFTITVANVNDVPVITGQNALSVKEDKPITIFKTDLTITDVDNPSTDLTLQVNAGSHYTFSGNTVTPEANFNGQLYVNAVAKDLAGQSAEYPVIVTVTPVNDDPVITSTPVSTAKVGVPYLYQLTVTEIDEGDVLTVTAPSLPSWLTLTAGSTGGILMGVPVASNIGTTAVVLKVNDGHVDVMQGFSITVSAASAIDQVSNSIVSMVYPNPASDKINFRFVQSGKTRVEIYDITGNLQKSMDSDNKDVLEISISELSNGVYLYKAYQNGEISIGKFTKN